MTGTTLESVSRTLSQFKKEGWINTGRQWIALKNPAELKKITEN
jgi:CRP-like cAMP-binding protein